MLGRLRNLLGSFLSSVPAPYHVDWHPLYVITARISIRSDWARSGIRIRSNCIDAARCPSAWRKRSLRGRPDRARVPAALRNAAYRYYGLGSSAVRRYTLTSGRDDPEDPAEGTQRAELVALEKGTARYRIVRTGELGALGSIEVLLDERGVHLVASSQGTLAGPALVLPARLESGATWSMEYVATPVAEGTPRR